MSPEAESMSKSTRADLARRIASGVLVLSTVPYLTLKITWLLGGRVGLNDLADSAHLTAMNLLTAGMDLVAALLAGVFAFRWGRRVPAWLLLFPVWVGTGLLGQILIMVPVRTLVSVLSGVPMMSTGEGPEMPVEAWVYAVVYGGFLIQGAALLLAFLLYARDRWPAAFTGRVGARPSVAAAPALRAVVDPIVWAVVVGTGVLVGLHVAWAAGFTGGIADSHRYAFDVPGRGSEAALAIVLAMTALGLLAHTRGWFARWPRWAATGAVWLGSGAMFGWGMWTLLVVLGSNPDNGVAYTPDLTNYEAFARFGLGLLGGVAFLLGYVERSQEREPVA